MGKVLSYLKNWGIAVNYCLNYRPSKLLLYLTEYRLNQLNDKYMKTAVKLNNTTFWNPLPGISGKILVKFFDPPTTKWQPCKIFAKLNGNHLLVANIFKLHEYQKFRLMKMHNMTKVSFVNNKFSLWKSFVFDYLAVENVILIFTSFISPSYGKIFWKNFLFYNGFQEFFWSSTTSQMFLIYTYLKMKPCPIKLFCEITQKSSCNS